MVLAMLVVLLLLSVWSAEFDLGNWNVVAALGISTAKALLIVLFFMHLYDSDSLTRAVAVGGLLWLGILIIGVMIDYETRAWKVPPPPEDRAHDTAPSEVRAGAAENTRGPHPFVHRPR